jgi:carboxypeptidase C (cathepsin A)
MGDSVKFYSETMKAHPELRVWVFSGTEDGVLSTLGTMRWINKLNFTVETEWTQYHVDKQVAGFAQKYKEGLVIVTVKGAGHMVPQDQRASAYKMYSSFINGKLPFE